MLNHITIMGRLTRDPELRMTQSQTQVASFTLAVDRDFGGRDGAVPANWWNWPAVLPAWYRTCCRIP